jgi:hypothetical protein
MGQKLEGTKKGLAAPPDYRYASFVIMGDDDT